MDRVPTVGLLRAHAFSSHHAFPFYLAGLPFLCTRRGATEQRIFKEWRHLNDRDLKRLLTRRREGVNAKSSLCDSPWAELKKKHVEIQTPCGTRRPCADVG